ncbi:MAG: hypothetical protein K8T26_20355 [Lentisphaerae bacterium]|nr:hypothetical protein [Lentisphaerota bacterium]
MRSISIRELHAKTGAIVREAARVGELYVTDRGKIVAKLVKQPPEPEAPYFSRRQLLPPFRKLMRAGSLKGGTDSSIAIAEDREDRA